MRTGDLSPPQWTGTHFIVDGKSVPYLSYTRNPTGWSEELAELVETESGNDRPLAAASRRRAVRCVAEAVAGLQAPIVLEVGAGKGTLLAQLRQAIQGVRIVGFEYAESAVARLAERLSGVPFLQVDITHCPLSDAQFDAVVCLNVIEHIEDDIQALKEIRRILKPGGTLILEVPAAPELYDVFDQVVGHWRRYRLRELTAKLEKAGFKVERASHLGCFVFPAARALKLANQKYLQASREEQWARVKRTMRAGRGSRLLRFALDCEAFIEEFVTLPFGVRCVITARRA